MAKKATITPVPDISNNATAVNTQLNAINDKLDNTLSLDGSTPNAMGADFDLNSNDILNGGTINASVLKLAGTTVVPSSVVTPPTDLFVNVKDFGAVGDGVTDDSAAIQAAIDDVSGDGGGSIYMPSGTFIHASTINIPSGIKLLGDSRGDKILSGPTKGTILKYTGTSTGISINGSMSGLEDVALVGTASCVGYGLKLNGDGNGVESWTLKDVSFYKYTAGTALYIVGINSGYVAYGYAESLRFRECLVGIHFLDSGGGSGFVNTNQFYGGGIAGGSSVDYCIRVQGGNDNRFTGMSVEPGFSNIGHIVVESGTIIFDGRIEGASQDEGTPLVEFKTGTRGSLIAGLGGDGLILDPDRKNTVTISSAKSPKPKFSTTNLFANSNFAAVTSSSLPSWTVTGSGVTFATQDCDFLENCTTLVVTVPAGISATISQTLDTSIYSGAFFSLGSYVKSAASVGSIGWSMSDGVSTSSSQGYLLNGTTQFVGHRKDCATSPSQLKPQLNLNNSAGGSAMVVEVTVPMVVVGDQLTMPSSPTLNSGYARMEGLFSKSFGSETTAISQIVLPKDGNHFVINGATTITRINQGAADRFPDGAEITLIAGSGGTLNVSDGAYILLSGTFSAANQWDNLTLIHIGGGVWLEKSRTLI